MFMNATTKERRAKIRKRRLVGDGGCVWEVVEVVLLRDWVVQSGPYVVQLRSRPYGPRFGPDKTANRWIVAGPWT